MGQERASRVGDKGTAADAIEEGRPQLVLEEVHAAADRGLGEGQRGGRPRESAVTSSPPISTNVSMSSATSSIASTAIAPERTGLRKSLHSTVSAGQ